MTHTRQILHGLRQTVGLHVADRTADLNEQRDFNQRHEQKQQKQTHLTLFVAGPLVDAAPITPYICALTL